MKLEPVEEVLVKDPFTGKTSLVAIDRAGHTEKSLIVTLADPNLSRERKDHALSMYLYERGKDSMSMIVDLMRYKGQHTKESRVFESRMRLDFESFVGSFTHYLNNQARLLGITLGVNIENERILFTEWLKSKKEKVFTYIDFAREMKSKSEFSDDFSEIDITKAALIEMAIYAQDEADALTKAVERISQARMAMKGGGIYVDKSGRPYSVNDPSLDEIIKKEREAEKEALKDDDNK